MHFNPRHQCAIYAGDPSKQIPEIGAALIERLNTGFRCIYMNAPALVSEFRSFVAGSGIDLERETQRGALVLSSDQSYLVDGRFEIDPMISMLETTALTSVKDGFTGLWASGDITWELGDRFNLEKLLAYECRLEQLINETPALCGICQYRVNTLPSKCIEHALYTHQGIFINETILKENPHYISPTLLFDSQPRASLPQLQGMLRELNLPSYPAGAEFN